MSRNIESTPYTSDEQRVVDYLHKIMPEIGAGDDPIGFLIASHASLLEMNATGERVISAEAGLRLLMG